MAKIPPGVGPKYPHVVVLFGATGDLSRRKLLSGLFHLSSSGFIPGCRIIGVSLEEFTPDAFREFGREALKEIKADPELRRIPIVVLTTSKAEEDILKTYDLGVNSYVTKPVTFKSLVDLIKVLGRYWIEVVELPPDES